MGVEHRLIRSGNFLGLNKRANTTQLSNEYATDVKNAVMRSTGAISKRKGFQMASYFTNPTYNNFWINGLFNYKNINKFDGSVTYDLLRVYQGSLQKKIENSITLYYYGNLGASGVILTGGQQSLTFGKYLDTNTATFKFEIRSPSEQLFVTDLGTGISGTPTLADLATQITNANIQIPIFTARSGNFNVASSQIDAGQRSYFIDNYVEEASPDATKLSEPSLGYTLQVPHVKIGTTYFYKNGYGTNGELWLKNYTPNDTTDYTSLIESTDVFYDYQSVTASSSSTSPAAVLEILENGHEETLLGYEQNFYSTQNCIEWQSAISGSKTFERYTGSITGSDNINLASVQLNNVMYFSDGVGEVLKYDGDNLYRAGLPVIPRDPDNDLVFDSTNISTGHTGNISSGTRTYRLQFEYTDIKGNIISSCTSSPIEITTTGSSNHAYQIDFSALQTAFGNSSGDFAGFDTTGTFDSTNFPGLPSSYPSGWSPARQARSKLQNEKRLRVKIWRTRDHAPGATGVFYLVADLPYDYIATPGSCSNSSYTTEATCTANGGTWTPDSGIGIYTDNIIDSDLNDLGGATTVLLNPEPQHNPPPKGTLLTTHRGIMVLSGKLDDVNNVFYSLGYNTQTSEIGSEYFPISNSVIVESPFGSKITAMESLQDFIFVFHEESVSVIAGDIHVQELPAVNLVTKEGGIGCDAPFSIKELNGKLYFLSKKGVYSVSSGGLTEESSIIKPLFNDLKEYATFRTITYNWADQNLLLMCIPKQEYVDQVIGPFTWDSMQTTDTLFLVYDYFRNAWFQWDGIDFTSGIAEVDNEIYFAPQKAWIGQVNKLSSTGTELDYSDHEQPISFSYTSNWETFGEPTIPKKFLRLKMYALDSDDTFESAGFTMTVGVQKEFLEGNIALIDFDFGGSNVGYGEAAWGTFTWGEYAPYMFRSKLPTGKTKALKLEFSNNKYENVLLTSYETEVALPFGTEIK